MNKTHNIWNQLTPEQTEALYVMLVEQNLTYAYVKERMFHDWNITVSTSSICRYYQRLMREKLNEDFAKVKAALKATEDANLDLGGLLTGVLTVMSRKLVYVAHGADSKELARLASLLLQHRQQEIQRGWLKLAREKYQHSSAEAALKLLPMAEQIKKEDMEREEKRIQDIMLKIFGSELLDEIIE